MHPSSSTIVGATEACHFVEAALSLRFHERRFCRIRDRRVVTRKEPIDVALALAGVDAVGPPLTDSFAFGVAVEERLRRRTSVPIRI